MKKVLLLVLITFGFTRVQSQILHISDSTQFNGALLPVFCGEYACLPILQSDEFKLRGTFMNTGLNPIVAKVYFYVSDDGSVIHIDSTLTSSIVNPGDSSGYLDAIATYNPQTTGRFVVDQQLYCEGDTTTSDNYYSTTILIDDSIYARDYTIVDSNDFNGTVGFQGAAVSFGQKFKVVVPSYFTSASFYLVHPTLNDHINVSVYSVDSAGAPNSFIGSTASYQISPSDTGGGVITMSFLTSIAVSPSTEYFVCLNQQDTNDITLGTSNNIYTPGSGYYNLNGSGWQPNENAGLNIALMLRVNNLSSPNLNINNSPEEISGFDIYPNPSNGLINITTHGNQKNNLSISVFNNIGQEVKKIFYNSFLEGQINLNELPAGIYFIKMQSDLGVENKHVVMEN